MKKYENLDLIGEEQYKKTNKVLRIVSICLISIGVLVFIFCLIGFIVSKNNYTKQYNEWYDNWFNYHIANLNDMPIDNSYKFLIMMVFSAMPIAAGIVLLIFTFRRQIAAYNINSVAPVACEVHEDYVKPFVEKSGSTLGKAYNNFKETANANTKEFIKIRCPHCGKLNREDAKYCDNCGQKL